MSALVGWRLVKARHAASAFDGEGARRFGGRWNARGTAAVYLSSSLSLAALELFVHLLPEDARLSFVAIRVEFPTSMKIDVLPDAQLPINWRAEPSPDSCKALGSLWLEKSTHALLRVPSIIVPSETNFLLNPTHVDVKKMIIHKPEPFGFDARMWK